MGLICGCTSAARGAFENNAPVRGHPRDSGAVGLSRTPTADGLANSPSAADTQPGLRATEIELDFVSLPAFFGLRMYPKLPIVVNVWLPLRVRDLIPAFPPPPHPHSLSRALCPASCPLVPALEPVQPEKFKTHAPALLVRPPKWC